MQIGYLNGLRGFCALWVLAAHEVMIYLPMALTGEPHLRHLGGSWEDILALLPFYEVNFAVCIFFLLSGFVLPLRYWQQEQRSSGCLTDAACRRYIRLTGPVFGAMLLAWLLMQAGWMRNQAVAEFTLTTEVVGGNGALVFHTPMSLLEFLRAAFYDVYTLGFPGLFRQIDFALWTMPFELQGSMMALAFLALLGRLRHRDVFYLGLCFFAGSTYFLAFPLGVWLSDICFARDREQVRLFLAGKAWLPWLCLLLGLYLGRFREIGGEAAYEWLRQLLIWPGVDRTALLHTIGGAFFLYGVLQLKWLQRFFGLSWLVSLGRYSFSMYLVHVPVLCSVEAALFMHFFKHGFGYGTSLVISFLLSLPVIALLTWGLDRFFDRPAQKFSRRFARWLLGEGAKSQ